MRLRLDLALGLATVVLFAGAAMADTAASQTGAHANSVDARLSRLLGQEKSSFSAVSPAQIERVAAVSTAPAITSTKVDWHKLATSGKIVYDDAWVDRLPIATGGKEWNCLTQAIYFEARGESVKGEFAVAEVVENRVDSADYPNTICGVVYQGSDRLYSCQFSFACDGLPETIDDKVAFDKAGKIARLIMDGAPRVLTDGATHFHTVNVNPAWAHRLDETAAIGAHVFYRAPVQVASN